MRRTLRPRAFTLIEVLVVVAIIALLISILLPSLSRAREQAKITTCKANAKQIASMMAQYQTEHKDFVPVLFNDAANDSSPISTYATEYPMRTIFLSVAFRSYDGGTRKSLATGSAYDPELHWNNTVQDQYQATLMPAYYACPFQRGKGPGKYQTLVNNSQYLTQELVGRSESYLVWRRDQGRDNPSATPAWSGAAIGDASAKYCNFSWNVENQTPDDAHTKGDKNRNRKWTISDARQLNMQLTSRSAPKPHWEQIFDSGAPSLSDVMVSFCGVGEYMIFYGHPPIARSNIGSHRASLGGGTNAMFADSHVEWVKGTRIGSP